MKLTAEQSAFIERFAAQALDAGVPPSFGKVLAYLLICQPREQSAEDIQTALKMSVGSVSTALNMFAHTGVAERITLPGHRKFYYRFTEDSIEVMVTSKLQAVVRARQVIEEGQQLPGADSRLDVMRNMYLAFENQIDRILSEINAPKSVGSYTPKLSK